jgi:aspartate dehydrogenase
MPARRIALIGFGAIASDLASALLARRDPGYRLGVLLAQGSASRKRVPESCLHLEDCGAIKAFAPHLVVEAAGHAAVRQTVPECLKLGLPVLISSVGALHDDALLASLVATAEAAGARILLPSGALGGLDYVRAMRGSSKLAIAYESRKPPAAWHEELRKHGVDPATMKQAVTLHSGTARSAAAAYPSNLNVAATLALAGSGFDGTSVRVVADPRAAGNTHVISTESELGTMSVEIRNRPSLTNPKSSAIVARSLLAAIEQHFSIVVML